MIGSLVTTSDFNQYLCVGKAGKIISVIPAYANLTCLKLNFMEPGVDCDLIDIEDGESVARRIAWYLCVRLRADLLNPRIKDRASMIIERTAKMIKIPEMNLTGTEIEAIIGKLPFKALVLHDDDNELTITSDGDAPVTVSRDLFRVCRKRRGLKSLRKMARKHDWLKPYLRQWEAHLWN
jgi:hypothetical protein